MGLFACNVWITVGNNHDPIIIKPIKQPKPSLKKLPERVAALQKAHSNAEIEVWAYDEHRIGLQPINRKVWAKRGERPQSLVKQGYEWLYLGGFVCPESGQTEWLIMDSVSIPIFNAVLKMFAEHRGVGANKQIVLVLDGAGWPSSEQVVIPEGIHFEFLPAYSPELQPAERLWPLSNEGIANNLWETLAALEVAQKERCEKLIEQTEQIAALTLYSWWPKVAV